MTTLNTTNVKPGDKVRVIEVRTGYGTHGALSLGSIHVVRDVNVHGIALEGADHKDMRYYFTRFELADLNGVDANGNAMRMDAATLQPFQRVRVQNGELGIVVVNEQGEKSIKMNRGGWVEIYFDADGQFTREYNIVKVFAPAPQWDALDILAHGKLIWEKADHKHVAAVRQAVAAVVAAEAELAEAQAALTKAKALRAALG